MVDIDASSADVNICKIKANISSSDVNISKVKADASSADADAQGFELHFCNAQTRQSGKEMVCKKNDSAHSHWDCKDCAWIFNRRLAHHSHTPFHVFYSRQTLKQGWQKNP